MYLINLFLFSFSCLCSKWIDFGNSIVKFVIIGKIVFMELNIVFKKVRSIFNVLLDNEENED